MLMMFDEMVLPICDREHLIVQETVVSLSLLVHDTLCPLLSDGLPLSTHSSSFSFICFVAMLVFQIFIPHEILTDINGEV